MLKGPCLQPMIISHFRSNFFFFLAPCSAKFLQDQIQVRIAFTTFFVRVVRGSGKGGNVSQLRAEAPDLKLILIADAFLHVVPGESLPFAVLQFRGILIQLEKHFETT